MYNYFIPIWLNRLKTAIFILTTDRNWRLNPLQWLNNIPGVNLATTFGGWKSIPHIRRRNITCWSENLVFHILWILDKHEILRFNFLQRLRYMIFFGFLCHDIRWHIIISSHIHIATYRPQFLLILSYFCLQNWLTTILILRRLIKTRLCPGRV